jgi:hypothetical protein
MLDIPTSGEANALDNAWWDLRTSVLDRRAGDVHGAKRKRAIVRPGKAIDRGLISPHGRRQPSERADATRLCGTAACVEVDHEKTERSGGRPNRTEDVEEAGARSCGCFGHRGDQG